jgi:hypothetical protein
MYLINHASAETFTSGRMVPSRTNIPSHSGSNENTQKKKMQGVFLIGFQRFDELFDIGILHTLICRLEVMGVYGHL